MNLVIKSRWTAFNKAVVGGCGVGWERTLGISVGVQEFYFIFSSVSNLERLQDVKPTFTSSNLNRFAAGQSLTGPIAVLRG